MILLPLVFPASAEGESGQSVVNQHQIIFYKYYEHLTNPLYRKVRPVFYLTQGYSMCTLQYLLLLLSTRAKFSTLYAGVHVYHAVHA